MGHVSTLPDGLAALLAVPARGVPAAAALSAVEPHARVHAVAESQAAATREEAAAALALVMSHALMSARSDTRKVSTELLLIGNRWQELRPLLTEPAQAVVDAALGKACAAHVELMAQLGELASLLKVPS